MVTFFTALFYFLLACCQVFPKSVPQRSTWTLKNGANDFFILKAIRGLNLMTNTFGWRWQESSSWWERVCRRVGQSGGLPGLLVAAAGLLQGHLGLPVLPGYRQLPVLFTEGALIFHQKPLICITYLLITCLL